MIDVDFGCDRLKGVVVTQELVFLCAFSSVCLVLVGFFFR